MYFHRLKKTPIIFAFGIGSLFSWIWPASSEPASHAVYFRNLARGHLLYHEGDYDEAMRVLDMTLGEWREERDAVNDEEETADSTVHDETLNSVIQILYLRASLLRFKSEMREAIVNLREAKTMVQHRVDEMAREMEEMKQQYEQNGADQDVEILAQLQKQHRYWRAWAHTLDGSLLELLYGHEQDAAKHMQQAISILPESARMSRNMAQYLHRMGWIDYAEFHTKEAMRKDEDTCPDLKKKVNPNIRVKDITANNANMVELQLGRAEDYELLAQFHLSKQEPEKSLQYSDASFGMVKHSFFGVMTKSRCLHQMGQSQQGVQLLREYMKYMNGRDPESQARMAVWASILSHKSGAEAKLEAEALVGDRAREKIAELDHAFDTWDGYASNLDPTDQLPTYPPILEVLKKRLYYNTLILDLQRAREDEIRIQQIGQQIDAKYGKGRRDSL